MLNHLRVTSPTAILCDSLYNHIEYYGIVPCRPDWHRFGLLSICAYKLAWVIVIVDRYICICDRSFCFFFFGIFLMNSLNWYGYWVCVIVKMLEVFLASVFFFCCDLSGQMRKKTHLCRFPFYIHMFWYFFACYICISICICMCVFRNNFKCISCLVYDFICYSFTSFQLGSVFLLLYFWYFVCLFSSFGSQFQCVHSCMCVEVIIYSDISTLSYIIFIY